MNILSDILDSAEYIYSTNTKWGLKRFACDVEYFTEEPLDDLFYVICSIVASTDDGRYDKRSLGLLLGFGMTNQMSGDKCEVYYDKAEVQIFEDLLAKVAEEHLISIKDNNICITELGRISLREGKHYRFYTGCQNVYEHSTLKSELPTSLLMFPFHNDMGIYSELQTKKQIWPNDEDIPSAIYYKNEQLIKRLELNSRHPINIYSAKMQEYFDNEVRKTPVKLYKYGEEYIPVIMNGDKVAVRATELLREDLNAYKRENVVLECLFQQLWDDKTITFSFEILEPYFDLVDYEELTKDSRVLWSDPKLFNAIAERANSSCWRNISRNCEISVLRNNVELYKDLLDWPILTQRIDDDFLVQSFLDYPWDLEVISEDRTRNDSVIEQLVLLNKETEEEWNWEELETRLSQSFVLSHLDVVKVNLSTYTTDTVPVRQLILCNIDKRWDWEKIETSFDLQYIYDNIAILGSHFNFASLFDRVFTKEEWSSKFAKNSSFKQTVAKACTRGHALSSSVFNDKNYIWNTDIIELFADNGLLDWHSTPYMIGFECNPYLVWDKEFFNRYNSQITTKEGKRHVSKQITSIDVVSSASNFDWDWSAISENTSLINNKTLYSRFGDKLDWSIVLNNQTDATFLQSIDNIESLIGENKDAWKQFSAIASVDYVTNKYNNPWDWSVLTERMFHKLKLENLGHNLFVDKWDWVYLSNNVDKDFLTNNLEKYSAYWDWNTVFPRILTPKNRLDYNLLDQLASILSSIAKQDVRKKAWTALTSQYTFRELKTLIKETVRKQSYWWDMSYFCQHKDFYAFRDLDDCRNIVDWNILSCSVAVDNSFRYNPKIGIKERAWHEEVRKVITDERNHWNYHFLSHFETLRDEQWFLSTYKAKLDWEYLSRHSRVFCERDKEKLNNVIEAYKGVVDFNILSQRNDIDIEQIIRINPKAEYDYNNLIARGVVPPTLELVEQMPHYPWNWNLVTSSSAFVPTAQFLHSHIDFDINWKALSMQDNQKAWSDEKLLLSIAANDRISKQINWYALSSLDYFPLTDMILKAVPLDSLNWQRLSSRNAIEPLIDDYKEYIDWTILSNNRGIITLNLDVLDRYKEYLDWSVICHKGNFVITNEVLDRFADYIDWNVASSSTDIRFSKQLVENYKDKWVWPVLVKNKAFNNTVGTSELSYVKQTNIVSFINKFPKRPKAYHFTHMENAVKIIRAMKLQSRNKADGNFSNSAGTNVHRTNKAHRFARFYFTQKSPTQFYNECLGKDKDDRYYKKAYNLGLPKCPLPVFFIFDIEELLSVMPDLCYYSNGNMQKDSSRCFKVVDDPDKIKAREIYINNRDTFEERQQEFLVEGELDFSKLKNVQICCYDDVQANMLRQELKGSKWESLVSCNSELYEYQNKELHFRDNNNTITIDTDYRSPFELRVSYSGSQVPNIINRNNVIRQRGNDIYMSTSVEIKKDTPFEVYFEVNSPRVGSWLIYRNK